jgi:hypothetical protein
VRARIYIYPFLYYIPISRNFNSDTRFFADEQILLTKSEADLQYPVHNLNNIAEELSMEISTGQTKLWLLKERNQSKARYPSIKGH